MTSLSQIAQRTFKIQTHSILKVTLQSVLVLNQDERVLPIEVSTSDGNMKEQAQHLSPKGSWALFGCYVHP